MLGRKRKLPREVTEGHSNMPYLSAISIWNADAQNTRGGWDPFWKGSCLLCPHCQSSIWCNTTVCNTIFSIKVTNDNRPEWNSPSCNAGKPALSTFCNYTKNNWKKSTKSSYEADIIPRLMLFYSRNTFWKSKKREKALKKIFPTCTRIDLISTHSKVLTWRSKILMFD